MEIRCIGGKKKKKKPVQITPFPVNPELQVQVNPPGMLSQRAFDEQLFPSPCPKHSLRSLIYFRFQVEFFFFFFFFFLGIKVNIYQYKHLHFQKTQHCKCM